MLVIVVAGVQGHAFGGDHHLGDAGLHHGTGAIHAGHDFHVDGASFGGRAGAGGVADGIALGVLDPEILCGSHQAFGHIVADDDAANLGVRILAPRRHYFADIEVILVPGWDLAHNVQLHFFFLSGKLKGFPQFGTTCSLGFCITITVLTGRRRLPTSADSSRARSTRMRSFAIRAWPTRRRSSSIRRCSMATKTPSWTSNTPATQD